MIRCYICSKFFNQISNSHLKKAHGITLAEYRQQFPDAPIVSEEVSNKISSKIKGKPRSEEHKSKLSKSIRTGYANGRQANRGMLGRTASEETREKNRRANTGRKHSEETKQKIGQGNKGKKMSPEAIAKQQASLKQSIKLNGGGFATGPRSQEFRDKMSEIALNRDPELVQKKVEQMWEARRGQVETEEQRDIKRQNRVKFMLENPEKVNAKLWDTRPELEFEAVLQEMNIVYKKQFHTSCPHYLYDFLVDDKFIVEIDGPYHYEPKLHGNDMVGFQKRLETDAIKNLTAGQKGYYIFRIKVGGNLPDDWEEQLAAQGLKIEAGRFVLPASKASK